MKNQNTVGNNILYSSNEGINNENKTEAKISGFSSKLQNLLNLIFVDPDYSEARYFKIISENKNCIFAVDVGYAIIKIIFENCNDISKDIDCFDCIVDDFIITQIKGNYHVEFNKISNDDDDEGSSCSFICTDVSYTYDFYDYTYDTSINSTSIIYSIFYELDAISRKAMMLGEDVLLVSEKEALKAYSIFRVMAIYEFLIDENVMCEYDITETIYFLNKYGFVNLEEDFKSYEIAKKSLDPIAIKKVRRTINKKLKNIGKNQISNEIVLQVGDLIKDATKDLPPNPLSIISNFDKFTEILEQLMKKSGFKGMYPNYQKETDNNYQYICFNYLHDFYCFTLPNINKYSIGVEYGTKNKTDNKVTRRYKPQKNSTSSNNNLTTDFAYLAHTNDLQLLKNSVELYIDGIIEILNGKNPSKEFVSNELIKDGYFVEMKKESRIVIFVFIIVETILGLSLTFSPFIDILIGESPQISAVYIGLLFLSITAALAAWYFFKYVWRNKHPKFLR